MEQTLFYTLIDNVPANSFGNSQVIKIRFFLTAIILCLAGLTVHAEQSIDEQDQEILKSWIKSQQKLRSISAEFTQTRALRTLRSPLTSHGRLWFVAPNWFRWELGDPPKTVIIGNPEGVTIIDFRKKLALKKSAKPTGDPESTQVFGMMRLPGTGSYKEFLQHVEILGMNVSGTECQLEILPRDAESLRRLSAIKVRFDTESGVWRSLEIATKEGSSIVNEFRNVLLNPKIDMDIFEFDLEGFKVSNEEK